MTKPTRRDLPALDPLPQPMQNRLNVCIEKLGMILNSSQAYAFDEEKRNVFTGIYNGLTQAVRGLSKLKREMIAVVVCSVTRCFRCPVTLGTAMPDLSADPRLGGKLVFTNHVTTFKPKIRTMFNLAMLMTEASYRVEERARQTRRDVGLF